MIEPKRKGHWEWDEGCPIQTSEESWDGGACPECGAMSTYEACWRWVKDEPPEEAETAKLWDWFENDPRALSLPSTRRADIEKLLKEIDMDLRDGPENMTNPYYEEQEVEAVRLGAWPARFTRLYLYFRGSPRMIGQAYRGNPRSRRRAAWLAWGYARKGGDAA